MAKKGKRAAVLLAAMVQVLEGLGAERAGLIQPLWQSMREDEPDE